MPDADGDEKWFDSVHTTDTSINRNSGHRTPIRKSTSSLCPAAPCRLGLKFQTSIGDPDIEESDVDESEDSNESGVYPLEETFEFFKKKTKSPVTKRQRRDDKRPETAQQSAIDSTIPVTELESKFSELHYLEASGCVGISRQPSSSDEMDKRDCKLLVSYRVLKEDPTIIQIALIVYKSNSKNLKTRRNLMMDFASKSTSSKRRTSVKDQEKTNTTVSGTSSSPCDVKYSKGVKRPINQIRL